MDGSFPVHTAKNIKESTILVFSFFMFIFECY